MSRQWKIAAGALSIIATALLFSAGLAAESEHYRSHPQVSDNAGGKPASFLYQTRASVGQHVVGPSESPDHDAFYAGYLYGAYAHPAPDTKKRIAISRLQRVKRLIPEWHWWRVDRAIDYVEMSLHDLWWIDYWHLNQEQEPVEGTGLSGSGSDESGLTRNLMLGNVGIETEPAVGDGGVSSRRIRYGERVFENEGEAAAAVRALSEEPFSPEAIEEFITVAWDIMDADSVLAQVKIVEAELSGGNENWLRRARRQMALAELEKQKTHPRYEKVVYHYSRAWYYAVMAEESEGSPEGPQAASIRDLAPTFALGKPYPNPSHSLSHIRYGIATECEVSLLVYDVSGRLVRTLVRGTKRPGYYSCEWDGRDRLGQPAASGTYLYRLTAGPFTARRKMVVLK